MATPPASYGYPKAAITADKLPIWQQPLARFTVAGATDWKVSSLASIDRGIRVEAGTGSGDAVTDVTFEYETLSLPSPNIASRWSLIVRRRNWSGTGTSKLVAIPGTAVKELPKPGTGSANRRDAPGVESDQPLALVRVTQKDTTVQEIIDLRCWASNGGVEIADPLALDYLASPGAAVKLGNTVMRYELQANGVWAWGGNATSRAPLVFFGGWDTQGEVSSETLSGNNLTRYKLGLKLRRTANSFEVVAGRGFTGLTAAIIPAAFRPNIAVDMMVSITEGATNYGGIGVLRIGTGGQVSYLPILPATQTIRTNSHINVTAEWFK